jgi:hypothetical protein
VQQKSFRGKLRAALIAERGRNKEPQNEIPTAPAGAMGSTTDLASAQMQEKETEKGYPRSSIVTMTY